MSTTTRTRKKVTKAQAEATFRAFKRKYEHCDLSDAHLVYDWYNGHPAICWESSDAYEWAIHWDNEKSPKHVFCEPYYSYVLVLYPDIY